MFKIIKTEYYDEFHCLMDKCIDNCCDENWIINIDESTYNKYKDLNIKDFDKKVSPDSHTLIKANGKCPFILDNGLCYWHKEYGEDYLSNTCKSYPRFVSSYGDVYIENIGLSCPASAKWVVDLDHKCEIIEKIYIENNEEQETHYNPINAEILMKTVVNALYKNAKITDGISELYDLFGVKEKINLEDEIIIKNDLIFCNVSICYLFEHIMLESKKENPNYTEVINNICSIITAIVEKYKEHGCNELNVNYMADSIYKVMRERDHII